MLKEDDYMATIKMLNARLQQVGSSGLWNGVNCLDFERFWDFGVWFGFCFA